MLRELLRQIAAAGAPVATEELARSLGVSPGLVEQMIEHLVRLGYLEAATPGCDGSPCRSCSRADVCSVQPQGRLWALTDRGRRLAREGTNPILEIAASPGRLIHSPSWEDMPRGR